MLFRFALLFFAIVNDIQVTIHPVQLRFRYPFRIAHGVRTHTDAVLVGLHYQGKSGWGEATLPPYLSDTVASTVDWLEKNSALSWSQVESLFQPDQSSLQHMPAKAALNMAMWNLLTAVQGIGIGEMLNIRPRVAPHTFTIGICDREEMKEKIQFAQSHGFSLFKLKMDGTNDESILQNYLSLHTGPFAIDANQGWKMNDATFRFAETLQDEGCILIEQPFHKDDLIWSEALRQSLKIPVIADEACQRLNDIDRLAGSFDGINIKLQKCGGISEALQMIQRARLHRMQILIGCMSESSVGCGAAEHLAPWCHWADLDGPWLIENDDEIKSIVGR